MAGVTLTIVEASELLGISARTGYRLAAEGRFPVPVLRVGHQWRVPTAAINRLLEVSV